MDDVISVVSSPASAPPCIDLGVIEITDSEPEDFGTNDLLCRGHTVKEDSPMDTDVPATMAGPSSRSPAPDPFPDAPPITTLLDANPPVAQEADVDPYPKHLALVLEVIPDVLPGHVLELITKFLPAYEDQVGEMIVQKLFDDPSYPKVEEGVPGKGKGKRRASEMDDAAEEPPLRVKIDFASVGRPKPVGKDYRMLALDQLYADFPFIPVSYIRRTLASNNGLYAPTHIKLTVELESDTLPVALKAVKTNVSGGKGKQRAMQDEDFEKERAWLLLKDTHNAQVAPEIDRNPQDRVPGDTGPPMTDSNAALEEDGGLECGCCFSPAPFHSMIQCLDAHLFCAECMIAYASNLLGEHNFRIICMDQSGCKLPFPESELRRFLTPKLLSLYEKVKQAKEIEMAGLDGLEECPHCDFKAVIDNPNEKLFRCQDEECGAVTCRVCKKPDHLPKSCAEVDEDKKIDARHVVEEAMTNALLRNCPRCNKVFIKESGCNKMTCPNCMTLSCYACRQIITGYEHFVDPRPGQLPREGQAGKCFLWDKVEERHEKEVEEAQKRAINDYRKEHPDMGEDALKVELPKATGEASELGGRRRHPRRPPPYRRIEPLRLPHIEPLRLPHIEPLRPPHVEPLRPPALDRYHQLVANVRQERAQDQEAHFLLPQQNIPRFDPLPGTQDLREMREVPQRFVEIPGRHREDDWAHRHRTTQQRDHAGRFTANNLRHPRPAALPEYPVHAAPPLQRDRAGGTGVGLVDREQVDQWRRMVVDPGNGMAS